MSRCAGTLLALALACALASTAHAQRCPRDTFRLVLPSAPRSDEATAHVRVRRQGGDPFHGPDGGTCVLQDGERVLVPNGTERVFTVAASSSSLLEIEIAWMGRRNTPGTVETMHVSMPARSEILFYSITCNWYAVWGDRLMVHSHNERLRGRARLILGPSEASQPARPCARDDHGHLEPEERGCVATQAMLGYCLPFTVERANRRHTFWLRDGEAWRVELDRFSSARLR